MVLVSYRLDNHVGLLQTKLSYREGHEARRIGLEAMPLDEHIEGGHGEREACLKIRPAPMHHLFKMADERQHRDHRLHQHAVLPRAARTHFAIGGIALGGMEAGITQDNHPPVDLANEPLKGVIRDMGGVTRPPHDQPPLVQQQAEFAADNPAMIGEAFPANLLGAAAFAHRVDQLDPIGVDDAEHRWDGQEGLRPVLMGLQEAKKPGALGEAGEQGPIVSGQPAIEARLPTPLSAWRSPKVTTSLGQRWASGCLGMAGRWSSTWQKKAVINSMVVVIDSSVPGRVTCFRPAWRKCMAMTRRP